MLEFQTTSLAEASNAVTLNTTFTPVVPATDRKSTRLNSSHLVISYAVFCLKKKKTNMLPSNNMHKQAFLEEKYEPKATQDQLQQRVAWFALFVCAEYSRLYRNWQLMKDSRHNFRTPDMVHPKPVRFFFL